ncbi:MAG TPA: HEAT repeat domain-containing protein [Terriglobales bacterium]|nr:HEAT repeat domain-containing protein [Terriglobales bacterium]
MRNLLRIVVMTAFSLTATGIFSGCSKENADVKKINVAAMMEALKGEDKDARINACVELAKAGPRAAPAVQALIGTLKDADPTVRRLAAYTLGEIGPEAKPALSALKELMNDPDRQVVMQVVNSLRSIDPKNNSDMKNVSVTGP